MSEELVKQEEVSIVKFEQFNNVNEMLKYAQLLIDSGLTALKKPEQVVLAANLGRALGVSFDVATQNIYNIQGRPTLSVHLITALAKKAGVDWEIVEDCANVLDETGKLIDKRTTIKFYRFNPKINRVMENTISYSYTQAQAAGYVSKDNWKTKLVNMLRARCLTEGIRFVASDVLMGVFYETGEMMDANNQTYDIDDEGNVILNK
jgi:hypothetical protein